eukprot:UN00587
MVYVSLFKFSLRNQAHIFLSLKKNCFTGQVGADAGNVECAEHAADAETAEHDAIGFARYD